MIKLIQTIELIMDVKKIIKIQSIFRGYLTRKKYRIKVCNYIIKLMEKNDVLMKECYIKILKVLSKFPPAKNECKFIYGKLVEKCLIKTIDKMMKCKDLDENHKVGSEYKFDAKMIIKFSFKAIKNKGSEIIIINKFYKNFHSIFNVNFCVCYITAGELYLFPSFAIDKKYVKENGSNIRYRGSIYKYLNEQKNFRYVFPKLSKKEMKIMKMIKEMDIYEYLYNEFIER
jgi:hypothetical protein